MPNLSKLSDEEIRQFILEKFEVEYKDPIFRKGFVSVNFTDSERKLDISIYDSNNLPPEHLSWTCNKDERIEFDKDGKARLMPARGLDRYIKEAKISDAAAPLIINPSARKLFLRLCFLEAIEEITRENIAAALDAIPHQTHPYILLQDELANKDGIFTQESVLAKMQDFVESHDLNQVEKARFCRAMQNIIDLGERDPDSEALRKSLSGIVTAITGALQIISGTTTPITTKQLSVESAAQLSTAPEVSLLK